MSTRFLFKEGHEGACGHVDAALLTHQQFLGRNSLGVRFTSVPEDTVSVPEEPEAMRRGLSAIRVLQARFQNVFRVYIAQKARGSCFGFSSPAVRRSTPSRRRLRVLPRPQLELSP